MLGDDERLERLALLPHPRGMLASEGRGSVMSPGVDMTDWIAPQWLAALMQGLQAPRAAYQGEEMDPRDALNVAGSAMGGGMLTGRGASGGLGMSSIRIVGDDFPSTLLHGTKTKNIKTLAGPRPEDVGKRHSDNPLLEAIAPRFQNEFGAEILLSEMSAPQQALMFSSGRGESLAAVNLRPGTKVLDVAKDMARAPAWPMSQGEPRFVRFFTRPDFTDHMIGWHMNRITLGYKQRNPKWEADISASLDPANPAFNVNSYREVLLPYARAQGYGAVRFADEVLITDRSVLDSARKATPQEQTSAQEAAKQRRGLFTTMPERDTGGK